MTRTKFLKGPCEHCGGRIEYPAESVGLSAPCPHCGKETTLMLARPHVDSGVPRKAIVYTVIGIVILALGLVAAIVALNRAERMAERTRRPAADASVAPTAPSTPEALAASEGFQVSPVTLEKASGSSLVYAVGTVRNNSGKTRFGVTVELALFNEAGKKVGTASDYLQMIEADKEWRFRALVLEGTAVSARLAAIKEDER
jgi:hypothetical protein